MKIVFYWDLLFLVNCFVGIVDLLMTSYVCRKKTKILRIIMGSSVGSFCFLCVLRVPKFLFGISGILWLIGITIGVTFITFGKEKWVQCWFCSTTICFLIGSIMNYLKMIWNKTVLFVCGWFVLFVGSSLICLILVRNWKRKRVTASNLYTIEIEQNGKKYSTTGYLDTGNLLMDPYTGRFVMLLNEKILRQCMEEAAFLVIQNYLDKGCFDYFEICKNESFCKYGFHEITYQSVGSVAGKLMCLYLENIKIKEENQVFRKQPVALAPNVLFEKKEYDVLLFDFNN